MAPTLYATPKRTSIASTCALTSRAGQSNLRPIERRSLRRSTCCNPPSHVADLCATLLYPVTTHGYRALYEEARSWPQARRRELIDVALQGRERRDELPRHFRSAPYVFDIVMDIGAYRDLHRHRRRQQLRQAYTNELGYETPALVSKRERRPITRRRSMR